jgi:hypothetical protein
MQQIRGFQRGIAVAPILFVIAILAVLIAAISSGSNGMSNTSVESARANAAAIIQMCVRYKDATRLLTVSRECAVNRLDFRPPNFPASATWTSGDFTGGNGSNRTGTGRCAYFHPMGGGMNYSPVPSTAMAATTTGAYVSSVFGGAEVEMDAFAGYPFFMSTNCINGTGTCPLGSSSANAAIVVVIPYLNYATCKQINNILGISWDPKSTFIGQSSSYQYGPFHGSNVRSAGEYVAGGGPVGYSGTSEACAYDYNSNSMNSAYVYMCPLLIR